MEDGFSVIDVVRAAHGERKQFWSETSAKRYDKIEKSEDKKRGLKRMCEKAILVDGFSCACDMEKGTSACLRASELC